MPPQVRHFRTSPLTFYSLIGAPLVIGKVLAVWLLAVATVGFSVPAVAAQPPAAPAQRQPSAAQQAGAQAAATQQPRIRLNTLKPVAGKNVVIVGRGLPAGSQVTARVTMPNGALIQESTRVQDTGSFRLILVLPNPGDYTLVVRGQGLDQMRVLEVQPVPPPNKTPKAKASQKPPSQAPNSSRKNTSPAAADRPAQGPEAPNRPASKTGPPGTEK